MERLLGKVSPILHLTRVTTAFAAVGNVWFVILWSVSTPEEHQTQAMDKHHTLLLLVGGAASALGLYAYGACLNDILDLRRDRALRPDRPLPSGRLSSESAAVTIAITLLLAILGSSVFGMPSVLLTVALAMGILFFNAAARFVPGVGLVLLGLIYAGHMLVPNLGLRFLWPVWLVMTHALAVAAFTHVLARKVPPLSGRALVFAVTGWVVWSVAILALGVSRTATTSPNHGALWPEWVPIVAGIGPALLGIAFLALAIRRTLQFGWGPRASDKVYRYGSLWLTLYGAAWMIGAGRTTAAAILGALALAGFLTMTTLRELYGLAEQPVGYRR